MATGKEARLDAREYFIPPDVKRLMGHPSTHKGNRILHFEDAYRDLGFLADPMVDQRRPPARLSCALS